MVTIGRILEQDPTRTLYARGPSVDKNEVSFTVRRKLRQQGQWDDEQIALNDDTARMMTYSITIEELLMYYMQA